MRLRGYRWEFHYAGVRPLRAGDAACAALCVTGCALLRLVDIAALVGGAVMR